MTENTTASGAAGDSLLLCASDLQHSAIYDNPHEMVDCVRAVADRITALAASAPVAPSPKDWCINYSTGTPILTYKDCSVIESEQAELVMRLLGHEAAPVAPTQPASITLDFKQATELLGMYGGEPTEVTLMVGNGHSGKGVYAHWTAVPEEGAMFLGVSDYDATLEAAPVAPAPQPVPQEWLSDQCGGDFDDMTAGQGYRKGWNDCRARMLAAAPKAASLQPDWCELRRLHALAVADADRILAEWRAYKPAPLQQGEYLPLPEPAIKACHCYSTNQVREAIDADRAARGAAQAAPAEIDAKSFQSYAETRAYSKGYYAGKKAAQAAPAPVAEDAANWHWLASYLVGPRTDLDDEIVASESVNDLRKLVSAARARAQAAQPEGGAK